MIAIKNWMYGVLLMASPLVLMAQRPAQGIQYQGAIRDSAGQWMANARLTLHLSLSSEQREVYYAEIQQVETDAEGQFHLVIGEGRVVSGNLESTPFEQQPIWLEMNMLGKSPETYRLLGRTRLLSVPYALHAQTASRLLETPDARAKSQSINWATSGNELTLPPTHFLGTRDEKDLHFVTNAKDRMVITKSGQVQIKSSFSGKDSLETSYPVTIKGSSQGIHIKVNGSRNSDNKFMVFGDDDNFQWGSIEGQTFSELEEDWEYQLTVNTFILGGVSLGLRIAAYVVKSIGAGTSIFAAGAIGGFVAVMASFVVEAAGLLAESITYGIKKREEIGVNYSSGAGDYAEWIPRRPGEQAFMPGDIVGAKEGLVSLNTENEPDHFFVVSHHPIVLGNTPSEAKRREGYEKIALMGQVSVKIAGNVSAGDYILPSGNNDGFGIAVHPDDMKTGDYTRIVGVAWEDAKGDGAIHFINVAVGINTNRFSKKVDLLNRRVENILAYLEGKAPLLDDDALAKADIPSSAKPKTNLLKTYTDEEFGALLDRHESFVNNLFVLVEKELRKKGTNPDDDRYLKPLFENPVKYLKAMRSDPSLYTPWAAFDQGLPSSSKKN